MEPPGGPDNEARMVRAGSRKNNGTVPLSDLRRGQGHAGFSAIGKQGAPVGWAEVRSPTQQGRASHRWASLRSAPTYGAMPNPITVPV